MRGQDAIIELRKSRRKPSTVFLNDYLCDVDRMETGDHFTVAISPDERIESLDLRFLVGLQVSISGSSEKRARGLLKACQDAGAAVVAAGAPADPDDPWCERNYSEVWRRG